MANVLLALLSKAVPLLIGTIGLAYMAACGLLLLRQNRMIFFPLQTIKTTPADANLAYQDVWIPVADAASPQEQIHGWWIPAAGPASGVVLYLHGNASNIGSHVSLASDLHQLGLSVMMIDYRGYGRSPGPFPSEQRVYTDAQSAWGYLVKQLQIAPRQIVLYGHSLGGAIAIELAIRHPESAGLIVDGSFTSIQDMVNRTKQMGIFPVRLLLHQRFDSIRKVRSLQMPVLFIHGTADEQVPADMSASLHAAAPHPKQLYFVPGAGHADVGAVGGPQYLQTLQSFLQEIGLQPDGSTFSTSVE